MPARRNDPQPIGVKTEEASATAAAVEWAFPDTHFAAMFDVWDDVEFENAASRLKLMPVLRSLDDIITEFEAYIGHSDAGFRAFRARHQAAMDAGLAETPNHPRLLLRPDARPGTSGRWDDVAWENRYGHLVRQRERLALDRLQELGLRRASFFGADVDRVAPEGPRRATVRSARTRGARRVGGRWYEPLDELLAQAARKWWAIDEEKAKKRFWGDQAYRPPTVAGFSGLAPGRGLLSAAGGRDDKENVAMETGGIWGGQGADDGVVVKTEPVKMEEQTYWTPW